MEQTINIMGGELFVYLNSNSKQNEENIMNFIISEIYRLVNIFNFFDKNSNLSKLNKNLEIDYETDLHFLLEESKKFYELSKGKFNVFLGKTTLERKSNKKSVIENNNQDFDIKDKKITLSNKNSKIDMGGIAKGYIIDKALENTLYKFKKEIIDILIDARGDIVCYGKNKKIIEVENPFNKQIKFNEITIKTGSIITSGHNKQYFKEGSHIIGKETDILTISLKSEKRKCYELDALGTYLIQLSSEEVLTKIEFEKYYENIDCLLILNNGKVLKSSFW